MSATGSVQLWDEAPHGVWVENRLFAGRKLLRLLSRKGSGSQGVSFQRRQRAALAADFAVHGLSGISSAPILTGNVDAKGGVSPGCFLRFIHNWDAIGVGRLRNSPTRANRVITPRTKLSRACLISLTMNHPMLAKFAIHYTVFPEHNKRVDTHYTDDPVDAELFLSQLLKGGARIFEIKHDGVNLEPHAYDRMIKIASERLAGRMIGVSLKIDYAEVRHRFGLAV